MTYEEFINHIKDGMAEILGDSAGVKVHRVLKNNDIELDALAILQRESNISPTIYLNYYYEEYLEGKEIGEIIDEIHQLYDEHSKSLVFDVDLFKDFEQIKGRIAYKLINTRYNEKLLEDIPNVPFLDLSIVFYCLLDNDFIGSATVLIHNVHKDMWKISTKELLQCAMENTPRLLVCELKNMNDLIKEVLVEDLNKTIYENDNRYDDNCRLPNLEEVADGLLKNINEAGQVAMYVLTNMQRTNGAACILYKNVIKEFADRLEKDIFILPSSVHEVILVPDIVGVEEDELTDMVREVNKEELDEIDVLSDHTYYYSRKDDEIRMGK